MKRKITLCILAIVITILICIGITYAYFSANVALNNQTETVIKSNELTLTFNGTSEINCSNLIPGESCTKTFNVKNDSNRAVTYNIYMQNITNEFNEDLVYTLTDETGVVVSETKAPNTNTEKTYILSDIEIGATSTKNYTLKVEFKYLATPQNDNQGASFKATVGIDANKIEQTPEEPTIINYNVGDTISIGSENFHVIKDNGDTVTIFADYTLGTDYKQSSERNEVSFANVANWETSLDLVDIDIQEVDGNAKTYVNNYVEFLKNETNAKDTDTLTGTLITIRELKELGCSISGDNRYIASGNSTCSASENQSWLVNSNQSYWTRNSHPDDNKTVFDVSYWGIIGGTTFTYASYGIRPVITISKSLI